MVRIHSPSSLHSSSSDDRLHPSEQFGGPGFHEPMLPPPPPPPETAAPHGDFDYHNHPPPPPPPPYRHSHHHSHHFGRPAAGEPVVSLPPAPHLFMNHNHSPPPPPPPPPFYGHDHGYPQQSASPPPPPPSLSHHYPPPPSHGYGHDRPQQFGRPALQEPMLFPPPAHESGAPFHAHHQQFGTPPPPPPPPSHGHGLGLGHPQQFGRSSIHKPILSPPPAHESGAPHLFISRNHSPPPPPPSHGHHHPPPPSHGHSNGHHRRQQFGRPAFHKVMFPPPPDLEPAAPHMFMSGNHSPPPPPPSHGHHHPPHPSHGHSHGHHRRQQFGRPAFHKVTFSPPPDLERAAPHMFMSGNHSPPPPPPSHGHSLGHGHHHSQQFGRPAFHKVMFSPPPDLEPAAPHMFMSGNHSPPPPPHLDYYNQPHSPSSSPHIHGGALHHPYEFGRPPAFEIEAPHLFMNHLHRNHSPPPPPPPPHSHHSHSHSSPSHGFEHHAAKFCVQPPMEGLEEGLHHYEPFPSGKGLHPSHQFSGHLEGTSNWLPSKEEHPHPHHKMGGGHDDYFKLHGYSYMPREMADGAHHGRHSPPHPCSPPPKHRGRPGVLPAYPPFCAPLVPAAHLSNGHRPHLAVPVW